MESVSIAYEIPVQQFQPKIKPTEGEIAAGEAGITAGHLLAILCNHTVMENIKHEAEEQLVKLYKSIDTLNTNVAGHIKITFKDHQVLQEKLQPILFATFIIVCLVAVLYGVRGVWRRRMLVIPFATVGLLVSMLYMHI